jgi:hypothetical protein
MFFERAIVTNTARLVMILEDKASVNCPHIHVVCSASVGLMASALLLFDTKFLFGAPRCFVERWSCNLQSPDGLKSSFAPSPRVFDEYSRHPFIDMEPYRLDI